VKPVKAVKPRQKKQVFYDADVKRGFVRCPRAGGLEWDVTFM
jgi:hypothetical protein